MNKYRYKAQSSWAIGWSEKSKTNGVSGLITPNTPDVRTGEIYPYVFLVTPSTNTIYIKATDARMSSARDFYTNDSLEKMARSSDLFGASENLAPALAIELDDIDKAFSNLGKYAAYIVRAVANAAETDTDIDSHTADLLMEALSVGIENAYLHIISSWSTRIEQTVDKLYKYFDKIDDKLGKGSSGQIHSAELFGRDWEPISDNLRDISVSFEMAVKNNSHLNALIGTDVKNLSDMRNRIYKIFWEGETLLSRIQVEELFALTLNALNNISDKLTQL